MEAVKNLLSVIVAIIGVMTAFLTLYAKYLDVKKDAGASKTPEVPTKIDEAPLLTTARVIEAEDLVDLTPDLDDFAPVRGPASVERARQAVKAPAITLMAAGAISLFSNLFIGAFGYVDQFVTPLTTETRIQQAQLVTPNLAGSSVVVDKSSDRATVVLTILVLLTCSLAGAVAIWSGYGMLRLRGYWLSVVGSFAIMPAGLFCCMGGVPVGVWSLTVLYKPEVASAFE